MLTVFLPDCAPTGAGGAHEVHPMRTRRATIAFAVAALCAATPASAEEGSIRFRGGLQAELGPGFFLSSADGDAVAGLTGHVGVQLGETFGIFLAPQVQAFMGEKTGPHLGVGLLGDVTIDDRWAIGLGPELGAMIIEQGGPGADDGVNLGLIGRLAVYPEVRHGEHGRRHGVVVGLDVHTRLVPEFYAQCGRCEQSVGPPMMVAPMLFIGHAAY